MTPAVRLQMESCVLRMVGRACVRMCLGMFGDVLLLLPLYFFVCVFSVHVLFFFFFFFLSRAFLYRSYGVPKLLKPAQQ